MFYWIRVYIILSFLFATSSSQFSYRTYHSPEASKDKVHVAAAASQYVYQHATETSCQIHEHHGFRYEKVDMKNKEQHAIEHGKHAAFASVIESQAILTQQPFLCPSIEIRYDAEWNQGNRITILLGIGAEATNWMVSLQAKNIYHPKPSWKVSMNYSEADQMYVFRPKTNVNSNLPIKHEEIRWNRFAFLSEKINQGEATEIEKIVYSQVNDFGQPIFQCTIMYNNPKKSIENHKGEENRTPRFRKTSNHHRRLMNSHGTNCSFFLDPPLTVGRDYLCYLDSKSNAVCDGNNNEAGQLNLPPDLFTQLSGYDNHVCGINMNHSIACWGVGYWDSDGNQVQPPTDKAATISAGGLHACSVFDSGNSTCWGNNDFYQCNEAVADYLQVEAGYLHTCGLTSDQNSIICWGYCDNNECMNPSQFLSPPYVQISVGNRYTCAVNILGEAKCWGLQFMGVTNVPSNLKYKQVTASKSGFHTCGLLLNNSVICWGDSAISSVTPTDATLVYIEAGANHACGLTNTSIVTCWGPYPLRNLNSPMGVSVPESCIATPYENVTTSATTIDPIINTSNSSRVALNFDAYKFSKTVSSGISFGCGNSADGFVYCWGNIYVTPDMQIFQGSVQVTASYVDQIVCSMDSTGNVACMSPQMDSYGNFVGSLFDPPTVTDMVQLSGKGKHVCALRSNTKVLCWGTNYYGQCRVPDDSYYYVATGAFHSCGITVAFNVRCWGRNNMGQASPPANSKFYLIALGYDYSCGITLENTIECWGNNVNGQATPPVGQFRHISAGYTTTCGIYKDNYGIVCWGGNTFAPNGMYSEISVGHQMTCATGVNGSSTCWNDASNNIAQVPADVTSVDMAFIPKNDGIRLCDLLGWHQYSSGLCVQQATVVGQDFNTTSCLSGVVYNVASSACRDVNGRLPTASEVTWDILNDIGCGTPDELVWTETKCLLNGKTGFKAYNKAVKTFQCLVSTTDVASTVCVADNIDGVRTCEIGHKCEQNCAIIPFSTNAKTACYCDDGFSINSDGLSCSLALKARSPKTCKMLNSTISNSRQFCDETPSQNASICSSLLPFYEAQMSCFNKGRRIPTVEELKQSNASEFCSNSMIWTSSPCTGYLFQGYVALTYDSGGGVIEQCIDQSRPASIYCIADPDIDECATGTAKCPDGSCINTEGSYSCICSSPSQMTSTGHCDLSTALKSNTSCDSLNWTQSGGVCSPLANTNISTVTFETCGNTTTYDDALSYCLSIGARLPTKEEISNTVLWQIPCGNSELSFWTSTNCSMDCAPKVGKLSINPFIVTGNQNAMCLIPTALSGFICVADQVIA